MAGRPRSKLAAWAHRWGMLVLVVSLLGWLWALSLWSVAQQRGQLLADRGEELSLMASAVAQHTAGTLRAVESDLRTLDLWLQIHPEADPLRDPRFIRLVEEMRRSGRGLIDPRMVGADGSLYYLPSPDARALANVADREYVKVPMSSPSYKPGGIFIASPVQSRVTRRWSIPVSMRISAPRSPVSADVRVIFASIELDRLVAEQEPMRFKPDGSIALIRADGVVLSRVPVLQSQVGRDLSRSRHFAEDYGSRASGSFVSEGHWSDGVERLVSFERLKDYPVIVLVSRGLDEIYATYVGRMRTALLLSGVLSAVVLAIALFLHRSYRQRDAMQSAQDHLHRLATTDELTGVLNRRAFLDCARREFERAQRYQRPTAVLALDIDHFKKVNDDYGHAGGDLVLQVCASRWLAMLRDHDLLGRIGGEEFCVLLPETSGADAARIAERLRAATAATPILGNSRGVSVSIGWTIVSADDADWATVLARADQALYQAKHGGRNRVHPPPAGLANGAAADSTRRAQAA